MNVAEKVLQLKQDFDDVYEAGKQAGGGSSDDSKYWDMVFDNGTRTTFNYTFSYWNLFDSEGNIVFNPPYDIVPVGATQIFSYIDAEIDLEAHLQSCGVKLDFSKCTMSRQGFQNSKFTRIGKCDFSKNPACNRTFEGCDKLVTIDEMELVETVNYDFTNMFKDCSALKNLTITGKIAKNNFNVQWSDLDRESVLSIVDALADKSADTSGTAWKITLGTNNSSKLSSAEIQEKIYDKGWDYA